MAGTAPINKSLCTKSLFRAFSAGSGSYTLSAGIYEIEVAGAGGGGGGNYWKRSGLKCHVTRGQDGGRGGKVTSPVIFLTESRNLNYSVGAGGFGGPGDSEDGGAGGNSSASVLTMDGQMQSWTGLGGTKGRRGKDRRDGEFSSNGVNSGNGQGAAGGTGGGTNKGCKGLDGSKGGNGWIKIYRYSC